MELIKCLFDFAGSNAGALIALSALFLAVWQGMSQRKHNRLSVKPHLVFERAINNHTPQIKISLSNTGTGPAIIKEFKIFFDNRIIDSLSNNTWGDILKQLKIPRAWGGGMIIYTDDAIQAGLKEQIFSLNTTREEKDPSFISDVAHKELDRIKIEINYESVYKEKFTAKFN